MAETLSPMETEEPKDYTDPVDFLDGFHESPGYQDVLSSRRKEVRRKNPNATDREIEESFIEVEPYKQLLFQYYHQHPLLYNKKLYSEKTNVALDQYWKDTMSYHQILGENPSPTFLRAAEAKRSMDHLRAADELVQEEKAPDVRIGRVLVHFLTVSEGVDSFDPNRDARRLESLKEERGDQ